MKTTQKTKRKASVVSIKAFEDLEKEVLRQKGEVIHANNGKEALSKQLDASEVARLNLNKELFEAKEELKALKDVKNRPFKVELIGTPNEVNEMVMEFKVTGESNHISKSFEKMAASISKFL